MQPTAQDGAGGVRKGQHPRQEGSGGGLAGKRPTHATAAPVRTSSSAPRPATHPTHQRKRLSGEGSPSAALQSSPPPQPQPAFTKRESGSEQQQGGQAEERKEGGGEGVGGEGSRADPHVTSPIRRTKLQAMRTGICSIHYLGAICVHWGTSRVQT